MRRFDGDQLLIATHNRGKLAEFAVLLNARGIRLKCNADFGLPEPAETGATFVANARIKARAAASATGWVALADDSGLEIAALGGAPGVQTADWAEGSGGRDFVRAMHRARDALAAAGAVQPWRARFVCALVLAWPDGRDIAVEGQAAGRLVWPMRGRLGHGYDPIFQPDGYRLTFAEMDGAEKNRISHRADALRRMLAAGFA